MVLKIVFTVIVLAGINGVLASLLVIAERFFSNYGECKITINGNKRFTVTGGSTLLSTLNVRKIFLPSACGGKGTCGYCKCKVTDGAGPLLPTEEPLLTKEEIENRFRLACQLKVKQDIAIHIPDELFNIKEYKAEVTLIKDLTYDIKLIRLRLPDTDEIHFTAGQYIQLQTEPYEKVKEIAPRAYSIASPSSEKKHIDLMIRLIPEGICTTWVHCYLKEGVRVGFTGPMGDFRLHEGTGEIIMVAGGSGMAPMVSILDVIVREKIERKVTYFFGAVTKKDLFFMEEMAMFEREIPNFTFVPALSQPEPDDDWKGEVGLITIPLGRYLKSIDASVAQAYMCGSPGMIKACANILNANGISNDRIYYDPFA